MADGAHYFAVSDVAARLGCQVPHVLSLIASGTLRAIDIGRPGARRRTWRVPVDAMAAFEAGRTNTPAAKPAIRRRRKVDPAFIEYF